MQPGRLRDGGSDAIGGGAREAQVVPESLGVVGIQGPDLGLGFPGDDGEGGEALGRAGRGGRVEVGNVGNHRAGFGGEEPKPAQRAPVVGRERRGVEHRGGRKLLARAIQQLEGVLRLAPLDARALGGALVGARRTMASRAGGAWVVEGAPPSPGPAGRAWQQGGRHPVADEITNTWILAAYPFPGAAARIPMEFVAHLVADGLVSDPPAPGLISRRVEVRELPGGPVLLVTVSAESHAAANWEQRVARVVAGLAARPLTRDFMNRHRRSFRSAKALEVADPEREGRRLLTELEATGGLAEPSPALAGLSPEEVQRAVAGLGEPRVLVYGPGEPPS